MGSLDAAADVIAIEVVDSSGGQSAGAIEQLHGIAHPGSKHLAKVPGLVGVEPAVRISDAGVRQIPAKEAGVLGRNGAGLGHGRILGMANRP